MILVLAFILLAALLLWFIIGARGKWPVKLAAIIIVPAFMITIWYSLGSYQGWPTSNHPPKTAYYVYGYVIEPDSYRQIKGAVYVWLIPAKGSHGVFSYKPVSGEPRAYRLKYTPKLERDVLAANKAVTHGAQIQFTTAKGKRRGHVVRGGGQSGKGDDYHFYPFRATAPPAKGAP